jgi:hypothetical protein
MGIFKIFKARATKDLENVEKKMCEVVNTLHIVIHNPVQFKIVVSFLPTERDQ